MYIRPLNNLTFLVNIFILIIFLKIVGRYTLLLNSQAIKNDEELVLK